MACPAECGVEPFTSEAELRDHLSNGDCNRIVHTCTFCNVDEPKYIVRQSTHPCQEELLGRLEKAITQCNTYKKDIQLVEIYIKKTKTVVTSEEVKKNTKPVEKEE